MRQLIPKEKNNTKLIVYLFISIFIFIAFDAYQLTFVGISPARILIILAFGVLTLLYALRISIRSYEIIVILFLLWSILVSLLNGRYLNDYHPMLIISLMILLIAFNAGLVVNERQLKYIKSVVKMTGWIIFCFLIYSVSYVGIYGEFPDHLPLGPFGSILTVSEDGHVFERGGFRLGILLRATLPFSRPQDFGLSCASIFLFICLFSSRKDPSTILSKILLFCLFLGVILSGSRSVIYPFGLALLMLLVIKKYSKTTSHIKFSIQLISGFSFTICVLYFSPAIFDSLESLSRLAFDFSSIVDSGHFRVRIIALDLLFDNISSTLFGGGIGSFSAQTGISSAHSTFFTMAVDLGLIGVLVYLALFLYPIVVALHSMPSRFSWKIFSFSSFFILCHLLYQFPTHLIHYAILGLMVGIQANQQVR